MVGTEPLGEHEIIDLIHKRLTVMPEMPVPFGDDVSGLSLRSEVAVLKTDMLVGATDMPPGMSLFNAARKAVVMNVSDFAAKSVLPSVIVVGLGLPRRLATKEAVSEIADGLNAGAREYGAYVIGGDTNEAADLIISLTLFGTTKKPLMLRSGAREGDIVAVTGLFGKTSAGLRVLFGQCKASTNMRKTFMDAVYSPKARLNEGLTLQGYDYVSASMDSSDGLAWCLHELARMSKVGFVIDKVPVDSEVEKFASINNLDAFDLAFYGGEEYELVFTVKPENWEGAKALIRGVGGRLIPIGKATSNENVFLEANGTKRAIEPRGWEHFKSHP